MKALRPHPIESHPKRTQKEAKASRSQKPTSHSNSNLNLPASTLLYTISICMLIGLLLSSLILLSSYAKIENDTVYFQELAQENLESGKNLILYGTEDPFGQFSSNLYDTAIDSYHVKSEPWGLYGLMHVTGVHGPAHARQSFLFGAKPEGIFTASLFLEDRNRPLILAGNTRLQGKCWIPEAGLRSGFVGRQGFTGVKLHDGPVVNSTGTAFDLHFPDLLQITGILDQLHNGMANFAGTLPPGDSATAPWNGEAIRLASKADIRLEDAVFAGKILIIAPKVHIRKEAQLRDILILANAVHIDSGFAGRLQIFANDSIVVEPQCQFGYPSALVLAPTNEFGRIVVGRKSEIQGIILCHPGIRGPSLGTHAVPPGAYVEIQKEATVVGSLLTMDNLDLKGTVIGNVCTGKFRLLTAGAVYDNHLLDATITSEGLHKSYAMPLVQKQPREYLEIMQLGRPQ